MMRTEKPADNDPIQPEATPGPKLSGKTTNFTSHIEIIATGKSAIGERFVKLGINAQDGYAEAVLRIDDLDGKKGAFARLNTLGAHLISPAARNEFMSRIQAEGLKPTSFRVATQIGFHGWEFVLPDEVISARKKPRIDISLDQNVASYASKFRTSRNKDWKAIPRLAKGNSRAMATLATGLVGPCSIITPLEQVAIQLVGEPGSGKSAVAVATGSIWGRHLDPNRARQDGFCETWKNTLNKFESVALAHNHTLLIADETRTADKPNKTLVEAVLNVAMTLEKAGEKGRWTDTTALKSWWVPFISTSNKGLDELCRVAGVQLDDAYRSRLVDIGLPEGGFGIFEDLHGYSSVAALSVRLKALAEKCFGWPSRRFIRKLVRWHKKDPAGLKARFERHRGYYLKHASKVIAAGRQLERIHQKFATIYAAGCLAIRFGIFPWTAKEMGLALLKCERDHVTLVAAQVVGSVAGSQSAFEKLLTYIRDNRHQFRKPARATTKVSIADDHEPLGYTAKHKKRREFWLTEERFESVVGGKMAADDLKKLLDVKELIATAKAGKQGIRYVVRRPLGGKKRQSMVVIRQAILDVGTATKLRTS